MTADRAPRALPWLIVAGVLLAALSLRGPIVAPTPVLIDIQNDLGIGTASAGLLTSVPVLMFAVLTPLAAYAIRRAGAEAAVLVALLGVLAGTLVRAMPGFGWMLAGSLVIGAAITVGNVVIPVIIRRDVPASRAATVTAAYAATLNAGSLLTSLGTAPLASVIGWPGALLAWSALTAAAAVVWAVHMRRTAANGTAVPAVTESPRARRATTDTAAPRPDAAEDGETLTGPLPVFSGRRTERSMLRRGVTWLLMLAFAGQTTGYYALTTWLPTLLGDELGVSRTAAGALASIFQGVGILGAFIVPLLARYFAPIVPAAVVAACWLVLVVGMLFAPSAFAVWASFGAVAHAGGFVVIFTALVGAARSDDEAAGMSAFVQGGGYAIGALGGPVMGALYEVSGGWEVPLGFVLSVAVAYGILLLSAVLRARRP